MITRFEELARKKACILQDYKKHYVSILTGSHFFDETY